MNSSNTTWLASVENWLDSILGWLTNPGAGAFLAIIIFICFIVVLGFIAWHAFQENWIALRQAIRDVNGIQDTDSFRANYNRMNASLEKNKIFSHSWKKFRETLISPPRSTDDIQYWRYTVQPSEYFNSTVLKLDMPFLRIMPNIFVGVGLALTFAGLIAALGTIKGSGEISPEDVENFLQAASTKFYASLSALFSSIILSISIKIKERHTERNILAFCKKIESGVKFIPAEDLALEQLEKIKEQTTQLTTFSNTFATKLGEQLETIIKKQTKTLTTLNKDLATELDKHFDNLAERIETALKEMDEGVIGPRVEGPVGKVNAQNLKELAGALAGLKNRLGPDSDINKTLAKLVTAGKTISDSSDKLKGNLGQLGNVTNIMQNAVKELEKQVKEVNQACATNIETLRKLTKQTQELWKEHGANFEKANKNLGKYFDEINHAAKKSIEEINRFVKELEVRFGSAQETLRRTLDKLTETVEDLKEINPSREE